MLPLLAQGGGGNVSNYTMPSFGLSTVPKKSQVHVLFEGLSAFCKEEPIYRPMWVGLQHHEFVPDRDDAYLVGIKCALNARTGANDIPMVSWHLCIDCHMQRSSI